MQIITIRGVVHDRMVVGFTTTLKSVPITTEVLSLNPAQVRCTQYNNM